MIEERMKIVYDLIIDGVKLTDDVLIKHGLSNEDIKYLVRKKIITFSKNDGVYELLLIDKFLSYGRQLIAEKRVTLEQRKINISRANRCFTIAYQQKPNSKSVCLQMLLATINRGDYKLAFEVFANLEKINPENEFNKEDNNLYLYLLCLASKSPEEYYERAINMPSDAFLKDAKNTTGNKIEDNVRRTIAEGNLTYALKLMNDIIVKQNGYSTKYELIRVLIRKAIDNEMELLLKYARNNQYEEIVSFLTKRRKLIYLTSWEVYILMIAEALINIANTGIIPIPTITTTDDLYEALVGKNFKVAQDINNKAFLSKNGKSKNDIISLLLSDINERINAIKLDYGLKENEPNKQLANPPTNTSLEHQDNEPSNFEKAIDQAEILVDYIISQNTTLENASKQNPLDLETILLAKLIYARDCYIEALSTSDKQIRKAKYEEGDMLVKEVESCGNQFVNVLYFLQRVKQYRDEESAIVPRRTPKNSPN